MVIDTKAGECALMLTLPTCLIALSFTPFFMRVVCLFMQWLWSVNN